MKSSPKINSFNAGYFSRLMYGRSDIKQYANACRTIRNFIPTVQGPARRRPGTHHVAEVKFSALRTWLHRFRFNTDQVYVLEFGDRYIRFFAQHGVVGAPFEVVTPYLPADLTSADGTFRLRFAQSGEIVYIFHEDYPVQKLTRISAVAFTLTPAVFKQPAFKDIDPNNTIVVGANVNGPGAGIALTAGAAVWTAADVGRTFRIEQRNTDAIKQWEPGKAVVINDVRRSDGKNYHALNNGNTGTVKPIHSLGSKYDGDAGVQWAFDDPGYGYGIITAFGGPAAVTATGITRFPDGCITAGLGPSTRWAFDFFNVVDGFPTDGTFYKERLVLIRGRDMVGSVAGDFENFSDRDDGGIVTADMAFRITTLSDSSDDINWVAPSNKALLFGTKADEQVLREANNSEPFGPGNTAANKQSGYGSHNVAPEKVGESVIFAQRNGRKLREMRIAESVDERWESIDLTVLAEDILKSGVIQIAFQQDPDSVVWCAMADGRLVGLTINREQEVRGWHEHRIGGDGNTATGEYAAVESVICIPGIDNQQDELWMVVRRMIGGATKRYVEWMGVHYDKNTKHPFDAHYVDSGLQLDTSAVGTLTPGAGALVAGTAGVTFTRAAGAWGALDIGRRIDYYYSEIDIDGSIVWSRASAAITAFTNPLTVTCTVIEAFPSLTPIATLLWNMSVNSFTGVGHLNGQNVDVYMDGDFGTFPVAGGVVVVGRQISKASCGLRCPAVLTPMPVEPQGQMGSTVTKIKRANRVGIRVQDARGMKYGRDEFDVTKLDTIPASTDGHLFYGDVVVPFPDGYQQNLLVTMYQSEPTPCTVVCLIPDVDVSEDR